MTKPRGHVNSYNPRAPLPGIGSIYVWELDVPHVCELITVTEVFWNGEEWWVRSVRHPMRYSWLIPVTDLPRPLRDPTEFLNDLSRFWEAVTPVRETRTPRPPLEAALADGKERP